MLTYFSQTLFEPQWFLPSFALLWLGMSGLLAFSSGWVSLAKRYATTGSTTGTSSWFASGAIGRRFLPVSYGSCLFVTTNSDGLHLSIFFIFRFLCPPLFIPWSEFESVEKGRHWFFPCYVLTIRKHWVRILLYAWTGRRAKESYESAKRQSAL
jgi:hypothetical protein